MADEKQRAAVFLSCPMCEKHICALYRNEECKLVLVLVPHGCEVGATIYLDAIIGALDDPEGIATPDIPGCSSTVN